MPPSPGMFAGGLRWPLLPAILGYTWWSYSGIAGKVEADAGYH